MSEDTPLSKLLGTGMPKDCHHVADGIAVHWWPSDSSEGDPCLCGELPYEPRGYECDDDLS